MILNGKTLNRFWAALLSDYEVTLGRYLDIPSLEFPHFAKICRDMELGLIMNMAVGRGKVRDEHYKCISTIILDAAKFFWLRKDNEEVVDKIMDAKLASKRRLGGFFLTYLMYYKQPYAGRTKISLGADCVAQVIKFVKVDVERLPVEAAKQVKLALAFLITDKAFSYGHTADEYGVEGWRRAFLTNRDGQLSEISFEMRDIQDDFAYGKHNFDLNNAMTVYGSIKSKGADCIKLTSLKCHIMQFLKDPSYFQFFTTTPFMEDLSKALKIMIYLTGEPILTLEQLTQTDSIDRRILAETRRRIGRQRKKVMENPTKASNPYVREGGIYGRKKEVEEDKESRERRERGMCSGNLWTYINGLAFDKPLGYIPGSNPPVGPSPKVNEE